MKILKKVKDGHKRKIYFCGIKILSYKKKGKNFVEFSDYRDMIWNIFEKYGYQYSLKHKGCYDGDANPIPWYTYPAIEYLSQLDYSNKRVFEYGSGNSSLFWSKRAKEVISVESSSQWYELIKSNNKGNLSLSLKEDVQSYSQEINNYENFDIIIIDGKWRKECAIEAINKLNTGGMIIFDNSDRASHIQEYVDATNLLRENGFFQIDFYGFTPLNSYTACTSIYFKSDFNIKTKSDIQPVRGITGIEY